ncbi:MAG: hypothetical protein RIF41_27120 [Polyangiaceae bacterium]
MIGIDQGGLMGGDTTAIVQGFIDQTGVTFPVGWDASGSYFDFPTDGAISPFPLDVVVDRQGRIAYVSREYDAEELLQVVAQLAAQP